ncbi:hypothetical protein [Glacieibacterium frigidum]|uniref:Uncharacterized protein n=1 Tax=Glacieibacterium frigidum TaxID=2593303 RepID=A0A552UGW9_9SPHN|nr:hypothetical protein [Glacieibacterium frigidum]TRW17478.1 hypothetical protein FMM06_04790 [Glacieibacterium frigidum]
MRLLCLPVAALLIAAAPPPAVPGPVPTYADLAALTLVSPVIVRATITRAERLGSKDAPDVAPGRARLLVRATLAAALKAPAAVPAEISYLVEVPLAGGKPPKLKGAGVLLFLRPGAEPGQFTLVSAASQIGATPAAEATARAVLGAARDPAIPVVTGIGNAFRVPGAIPGEAESQFFLTTAGRPVSLVVLTRPGAARTLSLALGEIVDDAAAPIQRDTLLWYRLACFLPRTLPERVGGDDRAALADDYAFVLETLGACTRNL